MPGWAGEDTSGWAGQDTSGCGRPGPQMHGRVRAPRTPSRGMPGRGAQPGQAAPQAQVGLGERVRVGGRAHQDVADGPRADARQFRQPGRDLRGIGSGVKDQPPACGGVGERAQGPLAGRGEPEPGQVGVGQHLRTGKDHAQPGQAGRPRRDGAGGRLRDGAGGHVRRGVGGQRHAIPAGQPARERARRGDRDLLAEDRPHGQFEPVVGAGDTEPGPRPHQRGDEVVGGQRGTDRGRVGIGVEQPAGPADHGCDRPQPGEPGAEQHMSLAWPRDELDDAGAGGGPDGPRVPLRGDLLHPGDRPRGQETQPRSRVERLAAGQPQGEPRAWGPGRIPGPRAPGAGAPGPGPQLRRGAPRGLQHARVELPDTGESAGERHISDRHGGLGQQPPRGLQPGRPGQGQRPGAQLGHEQPVQVPLGDGEPGCEAADPVGVDVAVSDQPHRPRSQVGPDIPLR